MNKPLTPEEIARFKKCIQDMGNITNCSQVTGMHTITINNIIDRGFAKQKQIIKLLQYCDEVEGLNENID